MGPLGKRSISAEAAKLGEADRTAVRDGATSPKNAVIADKGKQQMERASLHIPSTLRRFVCKSAWVAFLSFMPLKNRNQYLEVKCHTGWILKCGLVYTKRGSRLGANPPHRRGKWRVLCMAGSRRLTECPVISVDTDPPLH